MAKNSENLQIVYDDVQIAVGALAVRDCVAGASKIDTARLNGFRVMKTEYWMCHDGKTVNEGPLMVGASMMHSAGEVEEAIEADPQASGENDNALAKRPIFPLEMFAKNEGADSAPETVRKGSFNPRWSIMEGKALFWWVYNMNIADPITTGMTVFIFAKHYGVWLRD